MAIEVGVRVVRGPDWEWGELDGGEGHVGTVVVVEESMDGGHPVIVQWDSGSRCRCRCGVEGKFDLRVLDSAPTGFKHQFIQCDGCRYDGVTGVRWKCVKCYDFDLCTLCYMRGRHNTEHPFQRFDEHGRRARMPPRVNDEKFPATGLFPGAEVVRGPDWLQGNEDGGEGKKGKVLILKGWENETYRSAAEVEWSTTGEKSLCRVGHKGKVDIKCTKPFSLGSYYVEHLPVLGAPVPKIKPGEFASGDLVRVELDNDVFRLMQEGHGAWSEGMARLKGKVGTIHSVLDSGDVVVTYGRTQTFTINPHALTEARDLEFSPGEPVQILEDRSEVAKLQEGSGGWNEEMIETLGQTGVVLAASDSGVIVSVKGRQWRYNPMCLKRVDSKTDC